MDDILDNVSLEDQDVVLKIFGQNSYLKMGTKLDVDEGYRVALIKDEQVFDLFGPGEYIFSKKRLPKLSRYLFDKNIDLSRFKANIVFINREKVDDLKWGVNLNIDSYNIQSYGTYEIKIVQILYFLKTILFQNEIKKDSHLVNFFRQTIEGALKSYYNEQLDEIIENNFDQDFVEDNAVEKVIESFKKFGIIVDSFNILNLKYKKLNSEVSSQTTFNTKPQEENYEVYQEDKLNLGADLKEIFPSIPDSEDEESFVICTKCEKKIAYNNKYCPYCGTELELSRGKVKCKNCGEIIDNDSKYCSNCGELLEETGS